MDLCTDHMKWLFVRSLALYHVVFCIIFCIVFWQPALAESPTPPLAQTQKLQFRQALPSPAGHYSQALLAEAYKRLSIDVEFIDIPFGRSLLESNKGTLDGEIARVLQTTAQYPNLLAVPYILFDTEVYLYINQQRCTDCTLDNVKSMAYIRGTTVVESMLRKQPASQEIISTGTLEAAQALFMTEKVDAVIFAAYQIKTRTPFPVKEQHLMSLPDYHLLHRNHQALLVPLSNMLFQLEYEGLAARLRQQYGVPVPRRQLLTNQQPFATY